MAWKDGRRQVAVWLPDEVVNELEQKAKALGISLTETVVRAIQAFDVSPTLDDDGKCEQRATVGQPDMAEVLTRLERLEQLVAPQAQTTTTPVEKTTMFKRADATSAARFQGRLTLEQRQEFIAALATVILEHPSPMNLTPGKLYDALAERDKAVIGRDSFRNNWANRYKPHVEALVRRLKSGQMVHGDTITVGEG